MKVIEIIFTTLSWIICLFFIGAVCNEYDCEWLGWICVIIIGWAYGKYIYERIK